MEASRCQGYVRFSGWNGNGNAAGRAGRDCCMAFPAMSMGMSCKGSLRSRGGLGLLMASVKQGMTGIGQHFERIQKIKRRL